jgi:hypothetical protein
VATIITEEELERQKESLELLKQERIENDAYLKQMQDIEAIKRTHTELSHEEAKLLSEAMTHQARVNELVQLQNERKLAGQELTAAERAELTETVALRNEILPLLNDSRDTMEDMIEKQGDFNRKTAEATAKIKDAEKAQKEFKDKVDQGVKSLDTLKGIASSISPQLGNLVSNAQSLATGFAAASLAAGPLGGALFLAQEAAQGLLAASVKLSKILAAGVRESGLVDFEQMLYDNVAATNQFGMSAADTGKLLSGLSQNFSGFALASSEVQDAVVEQAAV